MPVGVDITIVGQNIFRGPGKLRIKSLSAVKYLLRYSAQGL